MSCRGALPRAPPSTQTPRLTLRHNAGTGPGSMARMPHPRGMLPERDWRTLPALAWPSSCFLVHRICRSATHVFNLLSTKLTIGRSGTLRSYFVTIASELASPWNRYRRLIAPNKLDRKSAPVRRIRIDCSSHPPHRTSSERGRNPPKHKSGRLHNHFGSEVFETSCESDRAIRKKCCSDISNAGVPTCSKLGRKYVRTTPQTVHPMTSTKAPRSNEDARHSRLSRGPLQASQLATSSEQRMGPTTGGEEKADPCTRGRRTRKQGWQSHAGPGDQNPRMDNWLPRYMPPGPPPLPMPFAPASSESGGPKQPGRRRT